MKKIFAGLFLVGLLVGVGAMVQGCEDLNQDQPDARLGTVPPPIDAPPADVPDAS